MTGVCSRACGVDEGCVRVRAAAQAEAEVDALGAEADAALVAMRAAAAALGHSSTCITAPLAAAKAALEAHLARYDTTEESG